jgi:hypothetical protein
MGDDSTSRDRQIRPQAQLVLATLSPDPSVAGATIPLDEAAAVAMVELSRLTQVAFQAPAEDVQEFAFAEYVKNDVTPTRSPYRFHKMKLLEYDRDLELAGNDVVLKFKGLGKKRRIMTVELKF